MKVRIKLRPLFFSALVGQPFPRSPSHSQSLAGQPSALAIDLLASRSHPLPSRSASAPPRPPRPSVAPAARVCPSRPHLRTSASTSSTHPIISPTPFFPWNPTRHCRPNRLLPTPDLARGEVFPCGITPAIRDRRHPSPGCHAAGALFLSGHAGRETPSWTRNRRRHRRSRVPPRDSSPTPRSVFGVRP
jgi:hypothetical protein